MPPSFGRTPFSCSLISGRTPLSSRPSECVPCAAWWRPSDVRCSVRPPSVWPCPLSLSARPIPVQAYLDSRPISYVNSIAYRRRTIPCRGSGCDPRPPSRVRLRGRRGGSHHAFSIAVIAAGGRSPQSFAALRMGLSPDEGQPFGWAQGCLERSRKAIETGRARREPCKAQPLGGCQVSRRTRT